MVDPTIGTMVVGALTLIGVIITVVAGNRSIKTLLVYRMDRVEERVEKHNQFGARLEAVEAECGRRQTECAGRFVGAKRDTKEALDEHCLSCHQGAKARP